MDKLSNGQAFPTVTASAAGGGEITLPDDVRGDWTVVLFYRGHF